jgi:hypothetical protein
MERTSTGTSTPPEVYPRTSAPLAQASALARRTRSAEKAALIRQAVEGGATKAAAGRAIGVTPRQVTRLLHDYPAPPTPDPATHPEHAPVAPPVALPADPAPPGTSHDYGSAGDRVYENSTTRSRDGSASFSFAGPPGARMHVSLGRAERGSHADILNRHDEERAAASAYDAIPKVMMLPPWADATTAPTSANAEDVERLLLAGWSRADDALPPSAPPSPARPVEPTATERLNAVIAAQLERERRG